MFAISITSYSDDFNSLVKSYTMTDFKTMSHQALITAFKWLTKYEVNNTRDKCDENSCLLTYWKFKMLATRVKVFDIKER